MNVKIFPITMPKWGIEMQQGTVAAWHVSLGSEIKKGTSMLDVETDKIVNSVEAPVTGTLRKILADVGAQEDVGALIAVFADPSVSDAEVSEFVKNFKPADARFEPEYGDGAAAASAIAPPSPAADVAEGEARVSPIARRIAERLGVDLSLVKGTGRNGRISKEDVEAFAATRDGSDAGSASAVAQPAPKRTPLSATRQAIARRLLDSIQGIPHYRLSIDVDCGALRSLRAARGEGLTLNPLLMRAVALALKQHPLLNAHLVGNDLLQFPQVDISVAVATDNGLITPVVRRAETKSAAEISKEIKELAARARAGTLKREEIADGTFTVSNLGMFGIDRFDAIINPPQVAILAIGAVTDRAVVRSGAPSVASVVTLTLSADHRAIDGAVGAPFLATLRQLIESPARL